MAKTILITGATDGLGLLMAQALDGLGHTILLHGRSAEKLTKAAARLSDRALTYQADLGDVSQVARMAQELTKAHDTIDVIINNAGVLKLPNPVGPDGRDLRFVVNTIAPYVLTRALLPVVPKDGRIINLSSAAQAPVDLAAFAGERALADMEAYAQSKLAITIWSMELAKELNHQPAVFAVNPGSLLATNMVREGFGIAGNDPDIGTRILCQLALDDGIAAHSGAYFDNDAGRFAPPHGAALDPTHIADVMQALNAAI